MHRTARLTARASNHRGPPYEHPVGSRTYVPIDTGQCTALGQSASDISNLTPPSCAQRPLEQSASPAPQITPLAWAEVSDTRRTASTPAIDFGTETGSCRTSAAVGSGTVANINLGELRVARCRFSCDTASGLTAGRDRPLRARGVTAGETPGCGGPPACRPLRTSALAPVHRSPSALGRCWRPPGPRLTSPNGPTAGLP